MGACEEVQPGEHIPTIVHEHKAERKADPVVQSDAVILDEPYAEPDEQPVVIEPIDPTQEAKTADQKVYEQKQHVKRVKDRSDEVESDVAQIKVQMKVEQTAEEVNEIMRKSPNRRSP